MTLILTVNTGSPHRLCGLVGGMPVTSTNPRNRSEATDGESLWLSFTYFREPRLKSRSDSKVYFMMFFNSSNIFVTGLNTRRFVSALFVFQISR